MTNGYLLERVGESYFLSEKPNWKKWEIEERVKRTADILRWVSPRRLQISINYLLKKGHKVIDVEGNEFEYKEIKQNKGEKDKPK